MSHEREQNATTQRDIVSDETLQNMFTAVIDVTISLNVNGKIQAVARDTTSELGYSSDQLVGKPITTILCEDDLPARFDIQSVEEFNSVVTAAAADGTTVPVQTAGGETRTVKFWTVPRPDADGPVCFGRILGETPPVVQATAKGPLDGVPDPVCVLDSEGRFDRVNDALVDYTGYDRHEILGRAVGELLPASASERAAEVLFGTDMDNSSKTAFEIPLVTKDGERIVTEANVVTLTDGAKNNAGSLWVFRDIQQRKHRERNLDLLRQVLARVFRHNVRNELVAVKGHAELLERQADDSLQKHAGEVLSAADRLLGHSEKARLVQSVIESGDQREHNLSEVVHSVVDTSRCEYPEATIETDLPPDAVVQAHPEIESAVEELLDNAIRHAPDKESAHVKVWLDRREDVQTLFVEDESGGLAEDEIDVLESGSEDDLEHSTGVGLWLIRWLVEYSNAEMIVHRTDAGSLMGIRFTEHTPAEEHPIDLTESSLGNAPARVRDVSPEQFRGDTVIGRVEPLDRLEQHYDSLGSSGGHSVLVKGEAGIGKTTLVEQFCENMKSRDDPLLIATGVCESDVQPAYQAFRQAIADLPINNDMSEILTDAATLSAEDSEKLHQRKRALFADIASELRAVAHSKPVILLIEDMQWADQGTIDLFEYLVDEVGRWGHPVLFLGTYRTSSVDRSHPVLEIADETAEAGRGTVIELPPFGSDEINSLLSHMLDIETLPDRVVQAVADQTGGTPLFVNELARQLASTFEPSRTGANLPSDLTEIDVPETVESAITERLASLPSEVRPVLALGAVIGREFSFDLLREASDQPTGKLIEASNSLARRDIWDQSGDKVAFAHGLVREQMLEQLAAPERKRLHGTVATAIETIHGDIDRHAGRLGYHYEQVGEYETAVRYYRQAGNHAADTYANDDAVEYYERAQRLTQDRDVVQEATRAAILKDIGEVLEHCAEYDQAEEYYQESLALSKEIGDETGEANSLSGIGAVARNRGNYDRARECAQESLELFREVEDYEGEAESLHTLGSVAHQRGAYDRATEYHDESLALRRKIGDREGEADSLHNLGSIARQRGNYDQAEKYYEESLTLRREIGDRTGVASSFHNLGTIRHHHGAYDRAENHYDESLTLRQEIGDRKGEARSLHTLGMLAEDRGVYGKATEYYEESLTLRQEIGDRRGTAASLNNLGIIAKNRGAYDQATEYYKETLALVQEMGDRKGEAIALTNLGDIATYRGAYDRAEEYYEESLALKREIGSRIGESASLCGLGAVADYRNQPKRAKQFVTDALEIAREIGDTKLELKTLGKLGAVTRRLNTDDRAGEYFDAALDLTATDELKHERGEVHLERGRLALDRDNTETAREAAEQAYDIFAELDSTHFRARANLLRGRLAARNGAIDEAYRHWRDALETFEDINTPQDEIKTLKHLVETCRQQDEKARADEYERMAKTVYEQAPAPVQEYHGTWLNR